VAFAPDAVFEACAFVSAEGPGTIEDDANITMIEAQRLVLDASTLVVRRGIAVRLVNATSSSPSEEGRGTGSGTPGNPFTLLSRNTDLTGLRIVGRPVVVRLGR
jgi:hypothetical protein